MSITADVRNKFATLGVDGIIVTRWDRFQGEYIQDHDAVLEFITGFTGSFGYAIVLKDKAALFIDGRYTLQARQQVDLKTFGVYHVTQEPMELFLSGRPSITLGFDPWCFSVTQQRQWSKRLSLLNITLKSIDYSFVDALWDQRPLLSKASIVPHDMCYAGCSTTEKLQKISWAENAALFLSTPESICWLLNVRGGDVVYTPIVQSYLLVMPDKTLHWFVDLEKITDRFDISSVHIYPINALLEELPPLLTGYVLAIDPQSTSTIIAEYLQSKGINILEQDDPCIRLKALKNETEADGFRQSHIIDGKAVYQVIQAIKERAEISEIDIDSMLLNARQKHPLFQQPSFPTIAGIGDHGAIVHYRADETSNRIAKKSDGTMILIDSGGQYLNGTTDITRTIWYGDKDPTPLHKKHYTSVLKGHIALARQEFPIGTTGAQLDVLARQYLWNEGLDYDHGTGHGVGSYLSVHEGPQRIGKGAGLQVVLQPGMVVSNEPGYYPADQYGIRIENLILVVPSERSGFLKFETLTCVPYEERLIDFSLLTKVELIWLENYHIWVKNHLQYKTVSLYF